MAALKWLYAILADCQCNNKKKTQLFSQMPYNLIPLESLYNENLRHRELMIRKEMTDPIVFFSLKEHTIVIDHQKRGLSVS